MPLGWVTACAADGVPGTGASDGETVYSFSLCCATPLALTEAREDDGPKQRLRRLACDFNHWNNPTPVLAAIVERQESVPLARNAAWQQPMFGLITGFMEAGETPEEGMRREMAEETGLRTAALITHPVGVHNFQRIHQVLVSYHLQAQSEMVCSPEPADGLHRRCIEPLFMDPLPAARGR